MEFHSIDCAGPGAAQHRFVDVVLAFSMEGIQDLYQQRFTHGLKPNLFVLPNWCFRNLVHGNTTLWPVDP